MRRSHSWSISAIAALCMLSADMFAGGAASAAPRKNYFPNLPVVTQDGKTLRFYDDLIKGKIVVIDFIYTNCKQICPLMTARLAQVYRALGDRMGRDIFMYSISLDPERDTPAVLKRYAEGFGAGPGWLFLTGEPKDIALIRYKLGDRSRTLAEHRAIIVLGNGATGQWMRSSSIQDIQRIVTQIRSLDPVWRARKRAKPRKSYAAAKRVRLDGRTGEALFVKACAACHTVGRGRLVGPDLRGITTRRDRDWLIRFMRAPDEMLAERDPIAVALNEEYDRATMPNLGLSEVDAADLIVYLERRTKRLDYMAKRAGARQGARSRPPPTMTVTGTATGTERTQ